MFYLISSFVHLAIRHHEQTFLIISSDDRIVAFKAKYNIPRDVEVKTCIDDEVAKNRGFGRVVIPLIAFVEGGSSDTHE